METRKLIAIVVLFIGILSLLRTVSNLWDSFLPDFSIYYDSTKLLLENQNPYTYKKMFTQINYPPVALLIFLIFVLIPFSLASKLWLIVSILSLVGTCFLLTRIYPIKLVYLAIFFTLSALAFPLKFTLGMGQINLLLLLSICCFIYSLKRTNYLFSGLFFSLAFILKIFPLIFFINLIIFKKYKVVIAFALFATFLILTSLFVFDIKTSYFYLRNILPKIISEGGGSVYYNQSLSGLTSRLSVSSEASFILRILVFLSSLVVVIKYKKDLILSLSFMLTVMLIVNSFTWQHHLVLLVIPFYILLKNARGYLMISLLLSAYTLIALNIKTPQLYEGRFYSSIILSHPFFGLLIIWFVHIFKLKFNESK